MSQETPIKKKRNTVVIALLVICIVLAASLIGVVAIYLNDQSQISQKDATIVTLTGENEDLNTKLSQMVDANTVATYIAQIANLNQQIDAYNATFADLNSEYSNLLQIVQMRSSGIMYSGEFTQDANTTSILYDNPVDYAGLVVVQATASLNSTYAQVLYTFGDYNFNFNQTLGTSGTAAFPIMPGAVQLLIGNMESTGNSVNATATFYF